MNLLKYTTGLVVVMALAACGSGGGNPGSPSGAPWPTKAAPTLVVQLVDTNNVVVASITSNGGTFAKAIARDADGAPIVNRLVTFSVSSDIATLTVPTALTNSAGEAKVAIVGAKAGAATLTAQALDGQTPFVGTVDFAVSAIGLPIGTSMVVQLFNAANAQVFNVTFGGGNYVKATFKDAAGAPIAGRLVTFSVSSSIATLAATTALTSSAGEAQVGIYPAVGATPGAATVQAQALDGKDTYTGKLDFAVASSGLPISPYLVVQLFDAANTAVSNVTFGGGNYVKATFRDAGGAPIVGRTVNFSLNSATIAV